MHFHIVVHIDVVVEKNIVTSAHIVPIINRLPVCTVIPSSTVFPVVKKSKLPVIRENIRVKQELFALFKYEILEPGENVRGRDKDVRVYHVRLYYYHY